MLKVRNSTIFSHYPILLEPTRPDYVWNYPTQIRPAFLPPNKTLIRMMSASPTCSSISSCNLCWTSGCLHKWSRQNLRADDVVSVPAPNNCIDSVTAFDSGDRQIKVLSFQENWAQDLELGLFDPYCSSWQLEGSKGHHAYGQSET